MPEQLVNDLRQMWKMGRSIEAVAATVVSRKGRNPLLLAQVLDAAFNCGGKALVRFANAFCSGTVTSAMCDELTQKIEDVEKQEIGE